MRSLGKFVLGVLALPFVAIVGIAWGFAGAMVGLGDALLYDIGLLCERWKRG